MKRFITFYQKDKNFIKMTNQTDKGFELIILSDTLINKFLKIINSNDEIYIVWQMKFKPENFILYKNCILSAPIDNFNNKPGEKNIYGKKIKIVCSGNSFYTNSIIYKNREVKKTKLKYKDFALLNRMLKISELNFLNK